MLKRILFFGLLFSMPFAFSQGERYFSFELLGTGGFGSFNYEQKAEALPNRMFRTKVNPFAIYYRAGFSLTPVDKNNGVVLIFPLMLHATYGAKAHRVDVGTGQTLSITTKGNFFPTLPLSFGYRYVSQKGPMYFRLAYTPIVSYLVDFQWQHWGGLTFGWQLGAPKKQKKDE